MIDHSEDFSKSTKGNGMISCLQVMSKGSLLSGKSRNWLRIWYDIVALPIEKLMEQFIGIPWVQSYDVRFRIKARKPSLIFDGSFFPEGKQ